MPNADGGRPPPVGLAAPVEDPAGRHPVIALLADRDCHRVAIALALVSSLLVPGAWLAAMPLAFAHSLWMLRGRPRLPFRLPASWKGTDYSSPLPGSARKFRSGEGILFLGNDCASGEELWISNSDARRHALVLATTGAGKALPDDALVLSPEGWRRNGDLRAGDRVIHPDGTTARVESVHPQGMLPVTRLQFADGRAIACSRDHLWRVNAVAREPRATFNPGLQRASDIGVALGLSRIRTDRSPPVRMYVELPSPAPGAPGLPKLEDNSAEDAALRGLQGLGFPPALAGTPEERLAWTLEFMERRVPDLARRWRGAWLDVDIVGGRDGFLLRQLIWSLGGAAMEIRADDRSFVRLTFPGQERLGPGAPLLDRELRTYGLEIIGAEGFLSRRESREQRRKIRDWRRGGQIDAEDYAHLLRAAKPLERPMSCIRTDRDDGMFLAEGYLPTHNTEFLLGLASQSMIWSSGFMFIDGKGTTEFHGRAWSIVSRFGRQDDYRVLNFTDAAGDPDAAAGGPEIQSNTLNPFAHGSADQLMNLITSLMGETSQGGDMWKHRAMALVTSTMKALCEMRDAGDVLLDVQAIRDYLPLGIGPRRDLLGDVFIADVSQIPESAWAEMRGRGGMIELYLRALAGEFSEKSRLALKGFFDSLPAFRLEHALNGQPQEGKAMEQHGFLAMQLTKPLGSLADDFGHIFRTPFGEVDIEDIVLNRRILVVLLPALQKAPEEMRNCGRIVVAMLKMMMGKAAGSQLEGSKERLVDSRPTRAPSPFIAVLDEAGYYMVKGIDTMMAQARSLGFMIVIAGQDMAAMQSVSPLIAETVAANARLTAAGATEDAQRTWDFLRRKFGRHRVPVVAGRNPKPGLLGTRWVSRPDQSFVEEDRVRISDLQQLREGEFYFLMESKLVKAQAFHVGEIWNNWLGINKFLGIRGPLDRSPGSALSRDAEFLDAVERISTRLLQPGELAAQREQYSMERRDALESSLLLAGECMECAPKDAPTWERVRDSYLLGVIRGHKHDMG